MPLVAGQVTVSDEGVVTFDPPTATDSLAGNIYTAEIAAIDEYTTETGSEVPDDVDRVATLKWFAKRSNKMAELLAPYINANI